MYKVTEPGSCGASFSSQICYFRSPVFLASPVNSDCRSLLFALGKSEKIIGVRPTDRHVQTRQELLISLCSLISARDVFYLPAAAAVDDDDDDDGGWTRLKVEPHWC